MALIRLLAAAAAAIFRRPVVLAYIVCWVGGLYGCLLAHSVWPLLVAAGVTFVISGIEDTRPV